MIRDGGPRTERGTPRSYRRPSVVVRSHLPEPHHPLGSARRQAIEVGMDGIEILARRSRAGRPHHDDEGASRRESSLRPFVSISPINRLNTRSNSRT